MHVFVGIDQCPVLDSEFSNPNGVPISGILFGGRRSTTTPLVYQCFNWNHGVFTGSTMASETTAAAAGLRGVLRLDPFSMKPFCGYNMSEYFKHWLSFGADKEKYDALPKMFMVNWFRKERGRILWPGFSENLRVIKWIFDRCDKHESDEQGAVKTSVGYTPDLKAFDTTHLYDRHKHMDKATMEKLFAIDAKEFMRDLNMYQEFYNSFDATKKVPKELSQELGELKKRLSEDVNQMKAL